MTSLINKLIKTPNIYDVLVDIYNLELLTLDTREKLLQAIDGKLTHYNFLYDNLTADGQETKLGLKFWNHLQNLHMIKDFISLID